MTIKTAQNNIPNGWIKESVLDLLDFERGFEPGSKSYSRNKETGCRFLRVSDMTGSQKEGIYIEKRKAPFANKGDILITLDGSLGVVRDDLEGYFSTGIRRVKFKNSNYSQILLKQLLKSYIFQTGLDTYAKGSTIRHGGGALQYIEILIPTDPKEQVKIAEILKTVDEEVEKTNEIIKATEKLKKGLMQKLFTQGIGHKKYKQTEIGELPESWEATALNKVCTKIGDGLHGTPEYVDDSDYYFINGNNLVDWSVKILPSTKNISEEEFNLHRKELGTDTVLLSINGTIGNVALYEAEKVALGKSVAYLNCSKVINRKYLAYQLQSNRVRNHFTKELTGTTIKNLSLRTIRETLVSVPGKKEQEKIVEILSAVDEKIGVNKKLLVKQTELKKGLMQDLLSGTKRVKV